MRARACVRARILRPRRGAQEFDSLSEYNYFSRDDDDDFDLIGPRPPPRAGAGKGASPTAGASSSSAPTARLDPLPVVTAAPPIKDDLFVEPKHSADDDDSPFLAAMASAGRGRGAVVRPATPLRVNAAPGHGGTGLAAGRGRGQQLFKVMIKLKQPAESEASKKPAGLVDYGDDADDSGNASGSASPGGASSPASAGGDASPDSAKRRREVGEEDASGAPAKRAL